MLGYQQKGVSDPLQLHENQGSLHSDTRSVNSSIPGNPEYAQVHDVTLLNDCD